MAGLNSSEVNIILSNNQIKKKQATKVSALLGHSNNNIKKLQNLNKKIHNQSNPFLRQQLREKRRKERRTLNLSKNTYNDIDYLERLIEEKNAAAKDAEGELILFIKNEPPYKDKFNMDDVILSIDNIKHIDINNSKYPNLLEWKEIHKELESFIDKLPNNTNNNYNKNSIIAEGRDYGFNVDAILEKLPKRSFLNRLPKLPKLPTILTRKNKANPDLPTHQNTSNTQKNSSISPATPVTPVQPVATDKPWYKFWGGSRKTNRKRSGGNFYRSGMEYLSLGEIEAAKIQAQKAFNDTTFEYKKVSQLFKQNPNAYESMAIKLAAERSAAKNDLNSIEDAEYKALERAGKAEDIRRISLGRSLNNAAREAREAPRRSSWFSLGRGGRKTHHKKRHMRKGSRKIHRK